MSDRPNPARELADSGTPRPGHEFNWQTGYCDCGWAGPAIDQVPVAHAAHVHDAVEAALRGDA
jgi:hypothetical protein